MTETQYRDLCIAFWQSERYVNALETPKLLRETAEDLFLFFPNDEEHSELRDETRKQLTSLKVHGYTQFT